MRIAIVGAGPAGLYLSYLIRRRRPDFDVRVYEQNAADASFGFGVVFSDRAVEFLRADDPDTCDAIAPHMESWTDMHLDIEGTVIRLDGIGFSAIGRLELMRLLQDRARSVGVSLEFGRILGSASELADADLIVAADGANSALRDPAIFDTQEEDLTNRFVWYGTDRAFETLTQTFRRNSDGAFNAHHYRYAPDRSTFIVETDAATWKKAGFERMNEAETRAYCEGLFADTLAGGRLISNKSVWRRFRKISNARWSTGNIVLIGDAQRTAHFSIGSGTRLAMEDAIALDTALAAAPGDIPSALADFEERRRPAVDALVAAADTSARWYEDFGAHMTLEPCDMAWSYIQRSGRVDLDRLAKLSPDFVARYRAAKAG